MPKRLIESGVNKDHLISGFLPPQSDVLLRPASHKHTHFLLVVLIPFKMLHGFSSLTDAFAVSVAKLPLPTSLPLLQRMQTSIHSYSNTTRPNVLQSSPVARHNLLPAVTLGLVLLAIVAAALIRNRRKRKRTKVLRRSVADLLQGVRNAAVLDPITRREGVLPVSRDEPRLQRGNGIM